MSTMMVLGLGVVLGMQHATEADHVAAVATLAAGQRSLSEGLHHGAAWGLGHTLMLLLVAGGAGLLGWAISPALAGRCEQVVGLMLVLLGLNLAWRLRREMRPAPVTTDPAAPGTPARHLPGRSLLVGMVHGLAGSAALALLVSRTMPSPAWGLGYIALFGLGSMLGMALLSGAMTWSLRLTAHRLADLHRLLTVAMAGLSVLLGLRLLLDLG